MESDHEQKVSSFHFGVLRLVTLCVCFSRYSVSKKPFVCLLQFNIRNELTFWKSLLAYIIGLIFYLPRKLLRKRLFKLFINLLGEELTVRSFWTYSVIGFLLFFLIIIAYFYFFFINPQQVKLLMSGINLLNLILWLLVKLWLWFLVWL